MDKINAIEKVENVEISEDSKLKALNALKDVYEEQIKDIKSTTAEHISSLKRDKKIMMSIIIVLGVLLIGTLVLDIFIGSIGWVRY